ncbi:endonuclease MutS2 [Latilactobacillus curvatus]|uniref:Endonuclease MutS2 n=1 Tax=Latilactobacillus curvatus TaxID=28038 RepID=A0ABN6GHL7_LATCU|nr:endonuclease MutS2 [Latilactobacillus curvatus]QEA49224.1 endonuclease MutS2 [Latilactobacillus curvatus]WBY48634.1 endonuclease MutS2 [Latilactobacillus curvatus]WIE00563.1 endonuclease MutS2 [Latilactobacillus curvatus]BCX30306.1 endonuclease MutS2 [Latilactobacillus curvatus]
MNHKILQTLEYDKIKQMLQGHAITAFGQEQITQLTPSNDAELIQERLDQTKDGVDIERLKGGIPLPQLDNIRPHLKRIEIGATLNGTELAQVGRVLRATSAVVRFFDDLEKDELTLKALPDLVAQLVTLPQLTEKIRSSVADDGAVLDTASTKLRGLRTSLKQLEGQIRSRMASYTHGAKAKYLSDSIVTIRNDRYVIPVKQEYRGQFGGVVHDQSASGQTLFMEPQALMELNNRLRQLQIEEQQEIERILAELSEAIMPERHNILANAELLGQLDFVNAKAQLAKALKATEPLINLENHVELKQARHPLIDPAKVVANDIAIGADYQAIVVTGPNTGGKTITLKTLGLVQVMAQSGLFITAREESQVGVFSDIFADIGDEQSIEQNLSTFSAHMENIIQILQHIDDRSLVLLDELGAGTDPQEGAALAIAILDQIGIVGADVVASTHYPELKIYGYNRPQTINASMEFDIATLQPTYRLLIGVPGRSNAFDISTRLGLPSTIVQQAKQLMNDESQDLNNMITDLENQRKAAETEYQALRHELSEATDLHQQLSNAYQQFFEDRETEMTKAKEKANAIVEKAEVKADKVITKLRDMQMNQGAQIKENQLIDAKSELGQLHQETTLKKNKVLQRAKRRQTLKEGDDVLVTSYGQRGTLVRQIDAKNWEVQMGIIKMKIANEDLEKQKVVEDNRPQRHVTTVNSGGARHVKAQLDLRGKRYEEAMAEVDQYVDAALLANYQQVTIVHGKGTGAIRQGVQDYLKGNRQVKKYEYAPANAGGNGATIVTFK